MRKLRWILGVGALAAILPAGPANAASPGASCVGQELSVLGPALGSELGAVVAFEARNPELEGRPNFGDEASELAHADRTACPEEG
jgi:hypothetical protein